MSPVSACQLVSFSAFCLILSPFHRRMSRFHRFEGWLPGPISGLMATNQPENAVPNKQPDGEKRSGEGCWEFGRIRDMAGKQTTQTRKARWNDKTSGNEIPFMEVLGRVLFRFLAFPRLLAIYRSSALPRRFQLFKFPQLIKLFGLQQTIGIADRADRIKGVFGFRNQSSVGGVWCKYSGLTLLC